VNVHSTSSVMYSSIRRQATVVDDSNAVPLAESHSYCDGVNADKFFKPLSLSCGDLSSEIMKCAVLLVPDAVTFSQLSRGTSAHTIAVNGAIEAHGSSEPSMLASTWSIGRTHRPQTFDPLTYTLSNQICSPCAASLGLSYP
jgi:hypothetical protein